MEGLILHPMSPATSVGRVQYVASEHARRLHTSVPKAYEIITTD